MEGETQLILYVVPVRVGGITWTRALESEGT
jgi:hypothetical protein